MGQYINVMKDSLKKFIDYCNSDEELEYFIRINADWNEESFIKMEQLVRKVMEDYEQDVFYHKGFVCYCTHGIDRIIGIISNEAFYRGVLPYGFTKESYKSYIACRIEKLRNIQSDFFRSL